MGFHHTISICAACFIAISTPAFASGNSQLANVTKVTSSAGAGGYTRITLDGTGVNPDGCTSGVTSNYYLDVNHVLHDTIIAMALTARSTDTPMRFFLSNCFTAGATTYPSIWSAEY